MYIKFLTTAVENPDEVVESVEEVSKLAQKVVDWANKTNVQAFLIIGGITVGVIAFGSLFIKPLIRKYRKR